MASKPATKTAARPQTTAVDKPKPKGALILQQDQVPAHIRQDSNRGSENVGVKDLVVPRLEIVQGLSPAVKRGDPGFIKGAMPGMFSNSVTRQLYGEEIMVVPVWYDLQYLVWRDRKQGSGEGGFFGAYPDMIEASERASQEGGAQNGIVIIDTPQHLCLLPNFETGQIEEIMISMPRTKAKISRQWNSMIKLAGGDRFGRVYKLTTVLQKNAKGDFYNFQVAPAGFPGEELYRQAEAFYTQVKSGARKVVMDVSGLDGGVEGHDDPGAETEF